MTRGIVLAAVAASGLLAGPAWADMIKFKAQLSAQDEVPPHPDLKGTGAVEASVDTTNLNMTYHVTFDGLTGPAKAAHFHGPAERGKNAGVLIPVAGGVFTGMDGHATISADQFRMMQDGQVYFNIHTEKNPAGEIRGQMVKE